MAGNAPAMPKSVAKQAWSHHVKTVGKHVCGSCRRKPEQEKDSK
jgi:hypothetical protein